MMNIRAGTATPGPGADTPAENTDQTIAMDVFCQTRLFPGRKGNPAGKPGASRENSEIKKEQAETCLLFFLYAFVPVSRFIHGKRLAACRLRVYNGKKQAGAVHICFCTLTARRIAYGQNE